MRRFAITFAVLAAVVLNVRPAHAWDDFGHRVVARIAWANMTPQARTRAIAILRAAAPETGLRGSVSGSLSQQQQISLFVFAATWPDVVRDTANPLRMEKYHHPYRHYVDTFWRQDTDFGTVVPVDRPPEGDLLRDTLRLQRWLATGTPETRALGLAWILHLVGDIHQPLHASGRMSPRDPWGDAGGNTFRVGTRSLHSVWDGILADSVQAPRPTAPLDVVTSAANMVMQSHPRSALSSQIGQRGFDQWAREGVAIAQRDVYRAPLVRDQPISPAYRTAAFLAAETRIALAGYRLAELLNQALG